MGGEARWGCNSAHVYTPSEGHPGLPHFFVIRHPICFPFESSSTGEPHTHHPPPPRPPPPLPPTHPHIHFSHFPTGHAVLRVSSSAALELV
jgi:hypothetical protein